MPVPTAPLRTAAAVPLITDSLSYAGPGNN